MTKPIREEQAIKTVLFDLRKAFDLIDRHIFSQKLVSYNLRCEIVDRMVDFLSCRSQRLQPSRDCYSECMGDHYIRGSTGDKTWSLVVHDDKRP